MVAFSAVGSLREEIKPRDFVVVDQILDWTKGVGVSPPPPAHSEFCAFYMCVSCCGRRVRRRE